jgi:hypothetical protein
MSLERLVKRETEQIGSNTIEYALDDPVSRAVSFVGNLPYKFLLLSKDVGNYPREKTQEYIKNYVKEKGLVNTTVRVGHSRVLKDTARLFTDEKLKDVSLIGRILWGLPTTLIGGFLSKLRRADYYNPFTKTAVIYSDVPAIAIHELGHASDYQQQRFPTLYSLFRNSYFGALYQELKASRTSHEYLKGKEKTYRYLTPALASYALTPLISPIISLGAMIVSGIRKYFSKRENETPQEEAVREAA